MTVLERVEDLLNGISPKALCDDCIADKLKITPRQHANQKTRDLQKSPRYVRRKALCSSCGSDKLVISWK